MMNENFSSKIKKAAVIGGCTAAAAGLPVFLLAPGKATKRQKAPFYGRSFAHRGLHTEDKSVPENSLEAFRLAGRAGYGVELDVQLTKDGQVVVFHDDTLDRVCGVPGKLSDKSYDELKLLSLCGTNQRIPLLTEVLEVYQGRGPLLVELKTGSRNRELCEKTYAILSDYPGEVCIESFNPMIVRWFKKHAKDLVRVGESIETEFGIPIVNKRISVTPIALVAAASDTDSYVPFCKALDRAAKTWTLDEDSCVACGTCAGVCPKDAIVM